MISRRNSVNAAIQSLAGVWYGSGMKPDVIDAKFKVIKGPRRQRAAWFDWQNFLIVGGLSLMGVLRWWLENRQ